MTDNITPQQAANEVAELFEAKHTRLDGEIAIAFRQFANKLGGSKSNTRPPQGI